MNYNLSYSPETANLGQIPRFLEPCDLQVWRMTLKNKRAPHRCYFELYASFHSHWCIETGVTVQKRPIGSNSTIYLSRVTLQFDVWPWKKIGHVFHATSSFAHHFVAIGEFKLELQSGNAQFGSNSTIFRARKTIGHLFYATSSFVYHFVAIGDFKLEMQSGNAQFGAKSMIFRAVWPCILMYDLEKQ